MLEKMIEQLREEFKWGELISTTEKGEYLFSLENNIKVLALETDKSLILKSDIGTTPQQHSDAFLLKAMEANLFGLGTRGAIIGLKDEGNLLTLTLELDYNSSYKEFKEKLEDFISVLDFWQKEAMSHQ